MSRRRWIPLALTALAALVGASAPAAGAAPSSLSSRGSAFTVTYRGGPGSRTPLPIQTAFVAGDRLSHLDLTAR